MKCRYIDPRCDFFELLSGKLGGDVQLAAASFDDPETLSDADVLIVALPNAEHAGFQDALCNLQRAVRIGSGVPVVAFLPSADRSLMRTAISAGAFDHFPEISSLEELRIVLRRAAQFRELHAELMKLRSTGKCVDFESVLGAHPKMQSVLQFASKVSATDASVLITGETGTGKELLARAIHQASPRASQPFIAVACSSLPETLIEAELFGHERGAFTGATSLRRGRFEAAERGTIFLDEIGELSPALQVKLLRVLQERCFERLGSNHERPMQARVICATNRTLPELVKTGAFRADLYYRLNTIEIKLPPLRERRDDIALLAYAFLRQYADKHNRPAQRISPVALAILQEHSWPGNVRELQHVIERAVVICDGVEICMEHLPMEMCEIGTDLGVSFEEEVRSFKRRLIQRALMEFDNNKLQAARSLKIARSSLHRLIDELHVPLPPQFDRKMMD